MTWFGDVFLSHQMGALKPDEAAFRYVLNNLGVEPGAILFLDDNPGNVSAARRMGINAGFAKKPEGLINLLHGLDLGI